MNWDPLEVAFDGVFCDAFGQATDGYFCAREVEQVLGLVPVGRKKKPNDRQDLKDIADILAILTGARLL